MSFVTEVIANLPARSYPSERPEPQPVPEPEPKREPDSRIETPVRKMGIPSNQPVYTVPDTPIPDLPTYSTKQSEGAGAIKLPEIKPTPAFEARQPKPKNRPGDWVTTNDYPTRDLRQGNQGRVGFTLSVDANGDVTGCKVTSSSGFAGLDEATCKYAARRARFEPATNTSGKRVAGTYSNAIQWVIPE